jgi:cupin fold WbuC family metalloprotein
MKTRYQNREVLYNAGLDIGLRQWDIAYLRNKAVLNRRRRIRLCAHKSVKDKLHEMFIVHTKGAYVRPHKHLGKDESLHIIEGSADLIFFDDKGRITDVVKLGTYRSRGIFYYRICRSSFHTLLIRSSFLVFHETITGPFRRSVSVMAPWSPDEKDPERVKKFMSMVTGQSRCFYKSERRPYV